MVRPSAVPKSLTIALMSASVAGSILAFASSVPPAKLSFKRPHNPFGSAAVMAMLVAITLSKRSFHSSGVKFDLSVTTHPPLLVPPLRLVSFPAASSPTAGVHRRRLLLSGLIVRPPASRAWPLAHRLSVLIRQRRRGLPALCRTAD